MKQRDQILVVLAIASILLGLFSALSTLELRAEEPRRAIVAMEMVLSGDWLILTINGTPYYNKPPFFNWVLASFFLLFGSQAEWVVRLPSLLAFLLTAGLIFRWTKKHLDLPTATLAALSYCSFADLTFYATVNSGEIDLFFTLIIFLQVYSIFHFQKRKQYFWLYTCSYLLTAIAFLTKGLPALLFQGFTLLAFLVLQKDWKRLFHPAHFLGILLLVVLVGGYFFAYHQREDAIAYLTNLVYESTQRTDGQGKLGKFVLHLLEFPIQFLKIALPWCLSLVLLYKKVARQQIASNAFLRFAVIFILANIWVYWVSAGTLDRYLYPFLPFIAILSAYLLVKHTTLKLHYLLYLIILIAALRTVYNFTFMPYQQAHLKTAMYRDLAPKLLELTDGQPIYFTGKPRKSKIEPSLFSVQLPAVELQTPPTLPYQIPYYLTLQTHSIMQYEPYPEKYVHYLTYKDFTLSEEEKVNVLYTFVEQWTKRPMVLIEVER